MAKADKKETPTEIKPDILDEIRADLAKAIADKDEHYKRADDDSILPEHLERPFGSVVGKFSDLTREEKFLVLYLAAVPQAEFLRKVAVERQTPDPERENFVAFGNEPPKNRFWLAIEQFRDALESMRPGSRPAKKFESVADLIKQGLNLQQLKQATDLPWVDLQSELDKPGSVDFGDPSQFPARKSEEAEAIQAALVYQPHAADLRAAVLAARGRGFID